MAFIYYVTQIQLDFGAVSLLPQECERSGIKKEMRRKEYYEKPSETRRRARLRAERRARRGSMPVGRV